MSMGSAPLVFALLYFGAGIGIVIYLLVLARAFVSAHERGAAALERIARKIGSPPPAESVSVLDRRP
jgi:hypothetical protein